MGARDGGCCSAGNAIHQMSKCTRKINSQKSEALITPRESSEKSDATIDQAKPKAGKALGKCFALFHSPTLVLPLS